MMAFRIQQNMSQNFRRRFPKIIHEPMLFLKAFDGSSVKCLDFCIEIVETTSEQGGEFVPNRSLADAGNARDENASGTRHGFCYTTPGYHAESIAFSALLGNRCPGRGHRSGTLIDNC